MSQSERHGQKVLAIPRSTKMLTWHGVGSSPTLKNEGVMSDDDKCSEGLWVYQISDTGGGVPEYRDRTLNVSFLVSITLTLLIDRSISLTSRVQ
jgi:hypothetical protein